MNIPAKFAAITFAFLLSLVYGCKTSDTGGQYAEGIVYPAGTDTTIGANGTAPKATGHSKIIIKGAKIGTHRSEIAAAIMSATRRLGPNAGASDPAKEQRLANDAASAILDGDQVILEGSPDTVDSIAEELRQAGLLVTTAR